MGGPSDSWLSARPAGPDGTPGPADEEWRSPSPRLRRLRRTELALVALPLIAAAVVAGLATGAPGAGAGAAGGVLVVAVLVERLLSRRVGRWGFAERAEDLLVRRGVMFRRESVIPYGRMQYVDVTAGPFERAFGLATVRMHTAAAASDARIPGLRREDAAVLRDRLSALGESHLAGL